MMLVTDVLEEMGNLEKDQIELEAACRASVQMEKKLKKPNNRREETTTGKKKIREERVCEWEEKGSAAEKTRRPSMARA